jgi:hypothetical protein
VKQADIRWRAIRDRSSAGAAQSARLASVMKKPRRVAFVVSMPRRRESP